MKMKVKSEISPSIVFTNLCFYHNKHVNHYASTFSDIFVTEKKIFLWALLPPDYYHEKTTFAIKQQPKKNLKLSLKPNYFKKHSSFSSFLLTYGNHKGPNGLVSYLKCMELACCVIQIYLYLYYYLR